MKLIIIESPYKGDLERNKFYLQRCIRDAIFRGESPYASHQMLTEALDDDVPEERKLGIDAGLEWRKAYMIVRNPNTGALVRFDPVLPVFYTDLGWSTGMNYAKTKYQYDGLPYEERRLPKDDLFFERYPAPVSSSD